ncbi:fibrobacter succinogenes major paralogous domain-containing protein [Bacteroidota bacterium]
MKLKSFSFLPGLVFLCSLLIQNSINAQNIAITDDESYTAESSAMLDVKSTSKGMLVPRMDSSQRVGISSPAAGLLVYDTDANAFFYFNGTNWLNLTTNVISPASASVDDALFSVVNANGDTVFAVYPEGIRMNVGDGVGKAKKGGFAIGGLASGKSPQAEYLRVTPDSIRAYIDTSSSKASKGGFAIGGLASGKALGPEFLRVTGDSVRVYIDDDASKKVKGGFAVGRVTGGKANPDNLFYVDNDTTRISNVLEAEDDIIVGGEIYDENGGYYSSPDTLKDYDGNEYQTILIGDQLWMAENLRTTHYADGATILNSNDSAQWIDSLTITSKAFCWPDGDSANTDTYGLLYTWAAVMNGEDSSSTNPSGVQGICPNGWHVPSDDEWKELEMSLGMSQGQADSMYWNRGTNEGSKLASDSSLWDDGALDSNESFGTSGFMARPAACRNQDGAFCYLNMTTNFWNTTVPSHDPAHAYYRLLRYYESGISRLYTYKDRIGYPVRCLQD